MTDPHTFRGPGPTIWPGRRGDGDLAYTLGGAQEPADVELVKTETHDAVCWLAGHRRAGPVHWLIWPRDEALRLLPAQGVEIPAELVEWTTTRPDSLIVMALAATDRPRTRYRPKRSPGKATRKASR